MKILQVVRQFLPSTGGMETYVSSLCSQLRRRGHQSDVATLDYIFKTSRRLPPYQVIEGTNIIRLPSLGNPRYFFAPRLLELLYRYDLVHVHGVDFFTDLLGALRRRHGKPVVLSTHGGFFHTDWHSSFKKMYFRTVTRSALRGVDRVIACSPRDERMFAPVTRRICLIENGIDFPVFADVKKNIRAEELLFVGRISKNKRVDRLIDALALVRKTRPGARLTIIGPDWEGLQEELEELAAGLALESAVNFTGELARGEMLAALARARLFVSASEYEAFGLSAVEAMATGTVPLLNDIEAFREFIDDGRNGFLASFDDAGAAAALIVAALKLPAAELDGMGVRARQTAERYDWEQAADEIINVYKQVLDEHERD